GTRGSRSRRRPRTATVWTTPSRMSRFSRRPTGPWPRRGSAGLQESALACSSRVSRRRWWLTTYSSTSWRREASATLPSPREILVVGAGSMASDYIAALAALGRLGSVSLHGRSQASAETLGLRTGVPATWGGTPALETVDCPELAFVAV